MPGTQELKAHEVRAQARWVRCSARKARDVLDTIRGRSVPEARTVLAFSTRAAARDVEKVLRSAVANAEANHGLVADTLVIGACYADEGPTLKRWRARARGRTGRIHKPTCHITIDLLSEQPRIAPGAEPKRRRATKPASEPSVPQGEAAVSATEPEPAQEKPEPAAKPRRRTAKPKAETARESGTRAPRKRAPRREETE
jgi:large subunit ribosomal protein L22